MIKDIILLVELYIVRNNIKRCNELYYETFYVYDDGYPRYNSNCHALNKRMLTLKDRWGWNWEHKIYNSIKHQFTGRLPENY